MSKRRLLVIVIVTMIATNVFAMGDSEAAKTRGQRVVGFAQVDNQNPWRLAETESIKSEAAKRGYKLIYSDAQADQANQIRAVRSFIAQGVDAILLPPATVSGWEPVLREAKEAKIPVILVDRNIDKSTQPLTETFVGSDFIWQGELAAKQLIKDLGTGPLRIAELQGAPGADPTLQRATGFRNVIAQYPDIKIVLSQTGQWNRLQGKEVMEAFLQSAGKDIDAVYAHNDDMAIGAIQAIKEYGLVPAKDIYLISIDAVRDAFVAMLNGELNVTVSSSPLMGPVAFDALEAVWAGKDLPDWIVVKDEIFLMKGVTKAVVDARPY